MRWILKTCCSSIENQSSVFVFIDLCLLVTRCIISLFFRLSFAALVKTLLNEMEKKNIPPKLQIYWQSGKYGTPVLFSFLFPCQTFPLECIEVFCCKYVVYFYVQVLLDDFVDRRLSGRHFAFLRMAHELFLLTLGRVDATWVKRLVCKYTTEKKLDFDIFVHLFCFIFPVGQYSIQNVSLQFVFQSMSTLYRISSFGSMCVLWNRFYIMPLRHNSRKHKKAFLFCFDNNGFLCLGKS